MEPKNPGCKKCKHRKHPFIDPFESYCRNPARGHSLNAITGKPEYRYKNLCDFLNRDLQCEFFEQKTKYLKRD